MTPAELPRAGAPPAARSHRAPLAALIVLYVLMMLPNLDNSYPYQGDETYYTISALTMIDSGDFLAPSYLGEYRFNKPILTYWLAAAAYKTFGVSMWSARVPILLLACLTILATHRLALFTLGDRSKALLASAMLAASPLFFSFSRIAMNEMVLTSLSVPAVIMFGRVLESPERSRRRAALGTTLVGLAFMAKGPVALLPYGAALIVGAFRRREGETGPLRALFNSLNLAIFAAIAVPWYTYAAATHPAAIAKDLGAESRVFWSNPIVDVARRALSYAWALAIFVFPFFAAGAALAAARRTRRNPACSYITTCIFTHLATFVFFVGAYKSRYLLPAIPLVCVVLADTLYPWGAQRWLKVAGAVLVVQAVFYALSPVFSGEPLRELTRRWQGSYAASGTLGIDLDAKKAGWCRLYAGNRGLAPPGSADFLIVGGADLPRYPGWERVATATRNSSLKFSRGRLSVATQAFHLIRRPKG